MRVRNGIYHLLEDKADELLLKSIEGVTNREDKSDFLTPWKTKHRATHEILTNSGVADPSVRRGQFTKAWNPDKPQLNSRDCPTRPMRISATWDPDEATSTGGAYISSEMALVFGVERVDT